MTYAAPLFVRARFMNSTTGEIKEQTVFMGDFPMMTDRGTFIINGTERIVVSQLVRSPGVYLHHPGHDPAKKASSTATIHPGRGDWIEFDVEAKPQGHHRRRPRRPQAPAAAVRPAAGPRLRETEEFPSRFVRHFDCLEGQWNRRTRDMDPTEEPRRLLEIYKRARPGEPPTPDSARSYFENLFFNPKRYDLTKVGRHKLERSSATSSPSCRSKRYDLDLERRPRGQARRLPAHPRRVLATVSLPVQLHNNEPDYRLGRHDHFANRRIRSVGELIQNQVRVGLSRMERVVRERMTTQDVEAITPQTLINIRPVVAAIKEFFGSSQLSQFMDQTNPLAGLTHKRRLSALGPGGLSRERAGFEVRDVHPQPLRADVPHRDARGPEHRPDRLPGHVRADQPATGSSRRRTARSSTAGSATRSSTSPPTRRTATSSRRPTPRSTSGGRFVEERVLVRAAPRAACGSGHHHVYGTTSEVDYVRPPRSTYMDVSPKQIVSVATPLIPFLEHDDANRALMGANMQSQAVPLLRPTRPTSAPASRPAPPATPAT